MLLNILYEYLIPSQDMYVPLTQQPLNVYNCISVICYCEDMHLIRYQNKFTCTSAIYYEKDLGTNTEQCSFTYIL